MRKFFGIYALAMVAGFAIWTLSTRVPFRVINGAAVPTPPLLNIDPSTVGLVAVIVGVTALLGAWFRERRLSRNADSRDQLSASVDDRLARIEQTLEAVALEVERIGEMERFATKLLAARQTEMEPRVPAAPPRVITPH
jgi:hypothetical protein